MKDVKLDFYFQPVVNSSKELYFAESLLRVRDVDGMAIKPLEYIAQCDDLLTLDIDVVEALKVKLHGSDVSSVSINCSCNSLLDKKFVSSLMSLKSQFQGCIILEFTESQEAHSFSEIKKQMLYLREYGFKFALDDFGVTYSNNEALLEFDFEIIKLDRFFISGISTSSKKYSLLKHTLNKLSSIHPGFIVIEGIETSKELMLVSSLVESLLIKNVLYQGFYFYRPCVLDMLAIFSKMHRACLNELDSSIHDCKRSFDDIEYEVLQYQNSGTCIDTLDTLIDDVSKYVQCNMNSMRNIIGAEKINRMISAFKSEEATESRVVLGDKIINLILSQGSSISVKQTMLVHCIDNSESLYAIRDSKKKHIYCNKSYNQFFNRDMVDVSLYDLVYFLPEKQVAEVAICIENDDVTLSTGKPLVAIEAFTVNNETLYFETIREPLQINDEMFVSLSVWNATSRVSLSIRGEPCYKEYVDELTRMNNRDYLNRKLDSNDCNYKYVIFIDLDGFKSVNDRFGHDKGDWVLIKFSEILCSMFRIDDLIVRWGGDEFIVLTENINLNVLHTRISNARRKFEIACAEYSVSLSYGVELIDSNVLLAIEHADERMYEEKRARKSRSKSF